MFKGLEVRSLLNLKVKPPPPPGNVSTIIDPWTQLPISPPPSSSNGFIRDSGDGLVYAPCQSSQSQPPKPLDQPKSEDGDNIYTVHAYLFLKRSLEGVINVVINDLSYSHDLKTSVFKETLDEVIDGCNICAQKGEQRTAFYFNKTERVYGYYETVLDLEDVEYCKIRESF